MIITRLMQGSGNQLFQIACGWAMAQRMRRPLAFDTRWYHRHTRRELALPEIHVPARRLSWRQRATLPHAGSRPRAATLAHLLPRSVLPQKPFRVTQDSRTRPDDLLGLRTERPIYLDGYWQSPALFADCADQVRRMFTDPSAPAVPRVQSGAHVAVHVRRGDYLESDASARFGVLSDDYYRRAITMLARELGSVVAVVFSDDPPLVQANLRLDVPTVYPDQARLPPLQALRLMASCDHFVIANSSFSWWAAWLGTHGEKQVVAPEPWSRAPLVSDMPRVPADWRVLEPSWLDEAQCALLRAARAGSAAAAQ